MAAAGLIAAGILGGCAVGFTPDNRPMWGFPVGDPASTIQQIGGTVGEVAAKVAPWLPSPWGEILGLAGAAGTAVAGGAWARSQGRHKGWSEREEAAAPKPAAPLPAPIPPAGQWQTTVSREPRGVTP